jgi:hypothetical protein
MPRVYTRARGAIMFARLRQESENPGASYDLLWFDGVTRILIWSSIRPRNAIWPSGPQTGERLVPLNAARLLRRR